MQTWSDHLWCQHHRFRGVTVAVVAVALVAAACGSSSKTSGGAPTTGGSATTAPSGNTASAPGVTPTTIKVALVTSETGAAAVTSVPGIPKGFQARIDQQNAQGGVDGRKITTIVEDDASSPSTGQTAVEEAVNAGVFAIDYNSAFAFGSIQYMKAHDIPVVGGGYDGPEWTEAAYANMFSTSYGVFSTSPAYTTEPLFIKDKGGTSVDLLGYGESPSSKNAALSEAVAAKSVGLKVPYVNTSLPFGTVNVGPIALAMKNSGADSFTAPIDGVTSLAILNAAQQTGQKFKVAILATGYGQSLLEQPQALANAQNAYFGLEQVPVELHTPATLAEQAAFKQYANFTGVPGFDWAEGYESADLLIKGLEVAGANPTRASFISNLRQVTSYTAGGLLPSPTDFATYQQIPSQRCAYYDQLKGKQFVVATPKPVCGGIAK